MNQFRDDNTSGYDAADLTALNAAWTILIAYDHLLGVTEWSRLEHHKHLSASLLAAYDQGLRGQRLMTAAALA